MKKRVISTMLSMALVLSMVACGSESVTENKTSDSDIKESVQSENVESSTGSKEDVVTEVTYPVEGNPELTIWIKNNQTATFTNLGESPVYQELSERTGVELEFVHPSSTAFATDFAIMMAAGDYPDLIQCPETYPGGVTKGVEDGFFLELTDYLPDYAPDYLRSLEGNSTANEYISREVNGDGIGAFYSLYNKERVEYVEGSTSGEWKRMHARRDWLSDWGMEMPRLVSEWETYFNKVLTEKSGVIPFALQNSGLDEMLMIANGLTPAGNGVDPNFVLEDGKVTVSYVHENMKDYLTLMNDWYNKGYIAKDFYAAPVGDMYTALIEGQYAGSTWAILNAGVQSKAKGIDLYPAETPRFSYDDQLHTVHEYPVTMKANQWSFAISTSCKNPEAACQLLNYAYTEEGEMWYSFGTEGVTYDMTEKGPVFTEYYNNHEEYPDAANAGGILVNPALPKLMWPDWLSISELSDNEDICNKYFMYNGEEYQDYENSLTPYIRYTYEESVELAKLRNAANTYTKEMILKFIIGEESLDNFDTFVEEARILGYTRIEEITQTAYERTYAK